MTKFLMLLCLLVVGRGVLAQSAGTVTYVYTDPQGTPLAEADARGNITATFDYTPYGSTALGTPPNGPGYTGHVNDPETNLVYMQARYYDPATGRFLSVDPAEKIPAYGLFVTNRYAYASNNPIVRIDPDGRQDFFFLSSSPIEPRPILNTVRPNPLTSAIRQGIRNPLPRTPAERAADLARQAGLKRLSPSEWKTGTQEPWTPPEVPSQFEHLDDLPEIVRLMYHLFRFASMGHTPTPDGVRVGPLPTVTVGPVQKADPPQQQQQPQQQPQPQQQQQQPVEPMPEICKTQQCA